MNKLVEHVDSVNRLMARYGVKFGIYKNNEFKEQLFPFDAIPRVIGKEEFEYLEKGLIQRVKALNLFLKDIYSDKNIIKDGIVPEDFVFSSKGAVVISKIISPIDGIIFFAYNSPMIMESVVAYKIIKRLHQ